MGATIHELPFFPEESGLDQLPFFSEGRVDDLPLPPTPPSVCNACWERLCSQNFGLPCMSPLDGRWFQHWPEEISYSTSFAKLVSRADAGCAWCRLVLRGVRDRGSPEDPPEDPSERLTITVRSSVEKQDDWQSYQTLVVKSSAFSEDLRGFVYAAPDDPAASYIPTRSPVLDVGSPRALALARQNIDECVRGHAECCQSSVSATSLTTSRRLPKRLVDCTNLARPRLISPTEDHGEYLALSYVWGNSEQAHQTTTSNVSAYERGINPRMLPQTLRDAIRVTHMLGFRSLWVDSLCILQDSPEDKAQEISGMHHIYRNAQLTIMAAGAHSVEAGFLCKRDPLYNDDQYIPDESEPPIPEDVALPFICPPRPATSMGSWDDFPAPQLQVGQMFVADSSTALWRSHGAELWRMSTRAWCLQEYLMSARALIFSPRTLLFKCLAGTRGVGGSLCAMFKEPRLPNTLFLPIPPEVEPGSKEWKDTHTAWLGVVKDYSRRSASVESDKLVACAAIAEQFHRALRSDYLAGLWRSDTLLTNLLWEADKVESSMLGRRHTRPTVYRAPSWSWASLEGIIQQSSLYTMDFEDTQTVALAKVVQCVVTLEDAALPFGRVTGGTLVLRGALIPCRGGRADRYAPACWTVPLPSLEHAQHQQWGLGGVNAEVEDELGDTMNAGDSVDVTLDCDADELPGEIWVVPLVRSVWSGRRVHFSGIVLERIAPLSSSSQAGHEKTRFRRCAYFRKLLMEMETDSEHPLWGPLTQAVMDGECPSMEIEIV